MAVCSFGVVTIAPDHLIFDLFGTLVFFDETRIRRIEVGGARLPVTVRDLAIELARVLPGVDALSFLHQLRLTSSELATKKRLEGIELHTSVRFEMALRRLGASEEAAMQLGRAMALSHMDSLARAVVCPADRAPLLRQLSNNYRLGLLSNFDDAATARRVLREAGLDSFFDAIVISDEEGLRKPNSELFDRTCTRLGADAARSLYVGDTLVEDIEGATGAGLRAVWIHANAQDISPAVATLPDVRDLPAWLSARWPG